MALKPAQLQWSDGGRLVSLDYDDIYFQAGQGLEESYYVFLERNNLPARFSALSARAFHVAELGFGTGLNFLLTADLFQRAAPSDARLVYVSFEKHPVAKQDLEEIYAHWPQFSDTAAHILRQYPPVMEGFHHIQLPRVHLMLCYGDVCDTLPDLEGAFDAWYLDGFAPDKNPVMWQDRLFPSIATRTKSGGTLTTFSAAGAVRRGLTAAGFSVEKMPGFGRKRDMTVARMPGALPATPRPSHVNVLGAGLAGCAASRALIDRGVHVTMIDRQDGPAHETSGNPYGVLYPKCTVDPSAMGVFHQHGFLRTLSFLNDIALPSWQPCGVVHLDRDADTRKRHEKLIQKNGFPDEYARYEKGLVHDMAGFLSPPELCGHYIDHPHIETRFGTDLATVPYDDDPVIIALGFNSQRFAQSAWLPLQSLRGQISLVKATSASTHLERVICHDGYIIPAVDGLHTIGATFQKEQPSDVTLRMQDHAENLEKLSRYLPDLEIDTVVGGRVGYRVTTPDKLPLVGQLPDYDAYLDIFAPLRQGESVDAATPYLDRMYVTTAFGAHGLSGTLIAADLIAAQIVGDPWPLPRSLAKALTPERFIFRNLKRRKI